jgi:hypothetical protein
MAYACTCFIFLTTRTRQFAVCSFNFFRKEKYLGILAELTFRRSRVRSAEWLNPLFQNELLDSYRSGGGWLFFGDPDDIAGTYPNIDGNFVAINSMPVCGSLSTNDIFTNHWTTTHVYVASLRHSNRIMRSSEYESWLDSPPNVRDHWWVASTDDEIDWDGPICPNIYVFEY